MNVKAITFHASAVATGDSFRPVVRIARQCADTGKTRLIGNKASRLTFATMGAAVSFAADRADSILPSLSAEFPDCAFKVTRRGAAESVAAIGARIYSANLGAGLAS